MQVSPIICLSRKGSRKDSPGSSKGVTLLTITEIMISEYLRVGNALPISALSRSEEAASLGSN